MPWPIGSTTVCGATSRRKATSETVRRVLPDVELEPIKPGKSSNDAYFDQQPYSSYLKEQDYKTILKQIIDYNCN
ncbi:MAG: hypothetical protein Q8869_01320 [Candidatus Phytoplasma australasiaticum]|nr:hypothetical protein [Candidatus Phytoplasma australasiaticum]